MVDVVSMMREERGEHDVCAAGPAADSGHLRPFIPGCHVLPVQLSCYNGLR